MPSILDYGEMVAALRTGSYRRAIERAVRPGDVVLDVGAGTGVLSLIACDAGAARVYAVDPDPMIAVAGAMARANGFADRIHVLQKRVEEIEIDGGVDVIVADIRGVVPHYGASPGALFEARRRFLRPGGTIIPASDTIHVAPVESGESYARFSEPWKETAVLPFDMEAGRRLAMNSVAKARGLTETSLLAGAQRWAAIDYLRDDDASDVSGDLAFTVERNATLHGFACWFDSVLHEDITLTNRPGEGSTLYSRAFFPLEQPVPVSAGDVVSLQLRARLVEDYVWSWTTLVSARDGAKKAAFTQSTFFGLPGLAR